MHLTTDEQSQNVADVDAAENDDVTVLPSWGKGSFDDSLAVVVVVVVDSAEMNIPAEGTVQND